MNSNGPILGIIPARAGSKRLPGKNLLPIGGKPMVAHTIEAALASRKIDRLVVTSDEPQILEIASHYRDILPLARPDQLATDTSLAIDYVEHALGECESNGEKPFKIIVIMQVTSPFTTGTDIDATLDLLLNSNADSAVSVTQLAFDFHPAKMKLMKGDRLLPYLEDEGGRMAAHQLPSVFVRNGSIYASRRPVIDARQIIGPECLGYVMPRERSVDVNDRFDYELASFLHSRQVETAPPDDD